MISCNRFVTKLSFMVRSGKMSCNLQEKAKDAKEFVHASADLLSRSCELRWDVPWRIPEVLSRSLRSRLPFSCHSHALGDSRRFWAVPGQVGLSGSSQCRLRRLSGAQAAQPAKPFAVVAEDAVAKPMVDREETSRSVVPSAQDLLSHFSQTKMNISRYVVISWMRMWSELSWSYFIIVFRGRWLPWAFTAAMKVRALAFFACYLLFGRRFGHRKQRRWLRSYSSYKQEGKMKAGALYHIALICITRLSHDHVLPFFYDTKRKWTTCTWTLSPDTWIQILICDPLPHRMVWLAAAAIPWFLVSCLWASHCEMCEEFPVISHFWLSSETWLEGERQRARLHLNC